MVVVFSFLPEHVIWLVKVWAVEIINEAPSIMLEYLSTSYATVFAHCKWHWFPLMPEQLTQKFHFLFLHHFLISFLKMNMIKAMIISPQIGIAIIAAFMIRINNSCNSLFIQSLPTSHWPAILVCRSFNISS